MNTDTMGVYGNYYLKRSIVALAGLGANQTDDAIYPLNISDAEGNPVMAENKYVLHFSKGRTAARGRVLVIDHVRRGGLPSLQPD